MLGGYSQSETVFKTLSFPDDDQANNKVSAYKTEWTAKIGTDTWSIVNFNNNQWKDWKYIKCGSKNAATIASIATENAFDAPISKVVVSYGKVSATDKLNKYYLQIASDAAFTKDKVTIDGKLENSGAFDYTFTIPTPVKGRYFKLVYDIQQTGGNGTIQVDKVEYWQKAESGKTATTLSFKDLVGEGVTLINGKLANGDDFNGYTATEKDKVAGTIAYAASGDGVATVDEKTGAVKVYPNVFGTTTITATFTPKDTEKYAESTASYTVINERTPTTITFGSGVDNNTFEVKDGEIVETRVATVTPGEATGSIVYESSDEAIAKVDAKTGAITLGAKYGTAVITARFDATGSFANSEASYSIKHVGDFVFYESFDKCDGKGGNDGSFNGTGTDKVDYDNIDGWEPTSVNGACKCVKVGSGSSAGSVTTPSIAVSTTCRLSFKAAAWNNNDEKTTITVAVSDGSLTYDNKTNKSMTINMRKDAWTDYSMIVSGAESFTVTFAGSGKNNRFFLDEVMVTKVAPQEITLDENSDNIVEAAENVNVTLKRTFYKDGEWNTLCLPFAVADAKTAFDGAELREVDVTQSSENTIVFKEATTIEAGKPYLIKWAKTPNEVCDFVNTFEGVTLVATATPVKVNDAITFTGFYNKATADKLGASVAAIGAGNKLFKVTSGEMKGFRAAFVLNPATPAAGIKVVIDGTTTGIEDLVVDGVKANGRVYNLNGQYVGNSLNGLQPGIYIQNGKKVVVK